MNTTRKVAINTSGGIYAVGHGFSEERWVEILSIYWRLIFKNEGKEITPTILAAAAKISCRSADKAILYGQIGLIPPGGKKGHRKQGVGSLLGFKMHHHLYIYELYLRNPSRPLLSYCERLKGKYGVRTCETTIQEWFHTIGPFKGTMVLTSKYPPDKTSWETQQLLHQFLSFVAEVDLERLVFMDEKPFKGVDIYTHVRKDPMTNKKPHITCDANSKNRYNVLAAVSLKKGAHLCTRVVEEVGDSILFGEFVGEAIREGVLRRGDILVVDNCTIHNQAENAYLQEVLLMEQGILMITLPPYFAELNPTELVFRALLMRLRAICCNSS